MESPISTSSGRLQNFFKAFHHRLQVPQEQYVSKGHQWSNHDLDPTPPEERKWSAWVYAAFWAAHAANASAWTAGSAVLALGLSWWHAWLALNVSHVVGTFLVVANGRIAARYHIGFPVVARASWGMWGSYMAVIMSSSQGWLWIQAFNSGMGTISSLTVNQADIARYSQTPNDQFWGQVLVFPIASAIPGLYGILVASIAKELYGKPIWNLWDVCQAMLNEYPDNSGARLGIFLAAASMALALIAVNLSTNVGGSLPAAYYMSV
ncbi:hypothetical protein AAF712_006052 [Marasmius tenuissimus]|uniref:Allantoin permease n=1 Tax=Marasmius tenuissimus TaxID=585030 RepID=A0ABR2ZYS1_9AGAR